MWVLLSAAFALFNMAGFPAIVTLVWQAPASSGMPMLIYTFWMSLSLTVLLAVMAVNPRESTSLAKLTIGGGVGLAGFALLLTQFSVASEGYEAVLPVITKPSDTRLIVREDFELTVRFDTGFVQKAYLEKGQYRVTRPTYYRYVDYTYEYQDAAKTVSSGRNKNEGWKTYVQALQGLVTLGLVRQYDANVGINQQVFPSPAPTTAGVPTANP